MSESAPRAAGDDNLGALRTDTQPVQSDVDGWDLYPGAKAPDRTRTVDAWGARLNVIEWGNEADPVLLLAHGGADFARTFDVFGPLLAGGGYRVVSWDHRCHGDSAPAALHSWEADCRDAVAVLDSCVKDRAADERAFAVGHSKGGGLMTELCVAMPHRFHCLVNIDGVPARGGRWSESTASLKERVAKRDSWLSTYLEHRRKVGTLVRRPGTPTDLVDRRARLNPRLTREWLQYLVTVGARHAADGWRWKLDPSIRMGNPGPWQPSWNSIAIGAVQLPMLAILGRHPEAMGWGAPPEESSKTLPKHAELSVFDDSGHFVHIEHPGRTAERVLQFLAKHQTSSSTSESIDQQPLPSPAPTVTHKATPPLSTIKLHHGRLQLAMHQISPASNNECAPLLCIHELGANSGDWSSEDLSNWPGAVWALDLAGHGESQWADGGGYAPEWQLADVDAALTFLSQEHDQVTLLGRGIGAYLSLLAFGSRPKTIGAAVLADGKGLSGAGPNPQPRHAIAGVDLPPLPSDSARPSPRADPLALAELSVDVRPPSYTETFLRQVSHLHLAVAKVDPVPIWNSIAIERQPPWLKALDSQLQHADLAEALHSAATASLARTHSAD